MESSSSGQLYFEKQQILTSLCAVHAINNLLGKQVCSQSHLNGICKKLSKDFFNPHRHVFGGDFDANIVIIALQELGYECQWLDSRNMKAIVADSTIKKERRVGYIVNRQLKANMLKQLFGLSQRHWIAIRSFQKDYYQLDSQSSQKRAELIPNIEFLLEHELLNQSHLFEVLKKE